VSLLVVALALVVAAADPAPAGAPVAGAAADLVAVPIAALTQAEIIAREEAAIVALGTYRVRFTKRERIDGRLQEAQTYELLIRPAGAAPLAIVGEAVGGNVQGRKLLYNGALRRDEFLVREGGLLGIAGSLWLSLDSGMAREDSNHPMTNMGFASVIAYIKADAQKTAPFGGHVRVRAGVDVDGYCILWRTPPGAANTYCREAYICFDPQTFLIRRVTLYDASGIKEDLRYQVLAQGLSPAPTAFTPAGAGL
jgi:hypothetical protein